MRYTGMSRYSVSKFIDGVKKPSEISASGCESAEKMNGVDDG